MTREAMQLDVTCDQAMVAAEVSSRRMVEWRIVAPEAPAHARRAPLNLALVVDRSGSMQGDKLGFVRQAACHVLDLLEAQDRLAVVAYDDQVTLLAPAAPVTAEARREIAARVSALVPGGWTNLSGGWLEGCRQVAAGADSGAVGRALLLTDGIANRGITDVEELNHHARELRRRGVATSTFGVGLDFNEYLLEGLANQGGGRFFYIERPQQIPDVFRAELGDLLTIVAREALLSISVPRGVAVELLGDLPHERSGERLRVFLGDLCAGERRALFTRVLTPPDAPGTAVALRGELGYAGLDGRTATLEALVSFRYAREAEVRRLPLDRAVQERAAEVELAAAAARALRLERAGERQAAQALLQQTIAASAAIAAPAAAAYRALAADLADGLGEDERKRQHFATYQRRLAREA
jgi:Ca-activated chloride channel family protein